MIPGWKLNPLWRVWHDMRRATREALRMQRMDDFEQTMALDAEARELLMRAHEQAMKNNEPRH